MWSGRVGWGWGGEVVVSDFFDKEPDFFQGGGHIFLQIDKESLSDKKSFFFFFHFFGGRGELGGGGGGGVNGRGRSVYMHDQMFQMVLLLFKENTCAKLF